MLEEDVLALLLGILPDPRYMRIEVFAFGEFSPAVPAGIALTVDLTHVLTEL